MMGFNGNDYSRFLSSTIRLPPTSGASMLSGNPVFAHMQPAVMPSLPTPTTTTTVPPPPHEDLVVLAQKLASQTQHIVEKINSHDGLFDYLSQKDTVFGTFYRNRTQNL